VHCIGDLHVGAITPARLGAISRDLTPLPAPALHLQLGDATERGSPGEDKLALAFLEQLPGSLGGGAWQHDILRNARSVEDGARATGSPLRTLRSVSASTG
jgi:hypothetical protein